MKSLFEQMGGTYRPEEEYLVPNITLSNEENHPIGIWGQRHLRYLKQHRKVLYYNLLTSDKLNDYIADIDKQAENMFYRLVKEFAEKENITEELKSTDQMLWVQKMSNIRNRVAEIVDTSIFA